MCVKLPLRDLNLDFCPHTSQALSAHLVQRFGLKRAFINPKSEKTCLVKKFKSMFSPPNRVFLGIRVATFELQLQNAL